MNVLVRIKRPGEPSETRGVDIDPSMLPAIGDGFEFEDGAIITIEYRQFHEDKTRPPYLVGSQT